VQAETALDSWRDWDNRPTNRPVILEPLVGGRSNRSFLLDSDIGKLVLRLNGADSLLPGAKRSNEIGIWRAASEQGIAPSLIHVDEQSGFQVSVYINNNLAAKPPLKQGFIDQAFDLLKRSHQLDVNAATISYADHIEQYWRVIETSGGPINPLLIQQRVPMRQVLETLLNEQKETVLCHHDPVIANFVGNAERLYLIDWEYAAKGLALMDYAAFGVEWGIDDALILAHCDSDPELLGMAKSLYGYICALWEEQMGPGASPG